MMLFWLLLPILAGCLSLNPNEPDRGFLEACGQLSMVHEGSEMGVLSGQCDGRDVSLDLNDCIEYHGVTDLQPGTSYVKIAHISHVLHTLDTPQGDRS